MEKEKPGSKQKSREEKLGNKEFTWADLGSATQSTLDASAKPGEKLAAEHTKEARKEEK